LGSFAVVLHQDGSVAPERVQLSLAAAPHRGEVIEIERLGRCAIGVGGSGEPKDTTLVAWKDSLGAVLGRFDNLDSLIDKFSDQIPEGTPHNAASVAIAAFRAKGEEAPELFRGQFAGAVVEGRRVWVFRDHLGFVPVFYRLDETGFYAATEAKQVVAAAKISHEPDMHVLEKTFFWDDDEETPCALRGVRRLPKMNTIVCDGGAIRTHRYWQPEQLLETADFTSDEIRPRFEHLMDQAVARTLTGSDVISLSGGIDSPAIAAFAAPAHLKLTGRPIPALSEVYPHVPSVDERSYIEIVCEQLRLPLHTFAPEADTFENLAGWARLFDGPVPSWSPNDDAEYYRCARELGYRNILTGNFAESVTDQRGGVAGHLLWSGRLTAFMTHVKRRRRAGTPLKGVISELISSITPRPIRYAYLYLRPTFMGAPYPDWLDQRKAKRVVRQVCPPTRMRWRKAQMVEFSPSPGLGLEGKDVLGAVCGVTVRRPWADIDLWEFFLSLPAEIKFADLQRKGLIRGLLRGKVPDAILDRRDKTVFNEWALSKLDYDALRKWLVKPKYALPGVKYGLLADRLEREDLAFMDYMRARDLAFTHAFLSQW
jgi:asparagine synthase (glutamine-hydrolysing)